MDFDAEDGRGETECTQTRPTTASRLTRCRRLLRHVVEKLAAVTIAGQIAAKLADR
jgi:hypothetical protein